MDKPSMQAPIDSDEDLTSLQVASLDPAAPESVDVEPIRGKVAKVLSARRLVINRGSEHGVDLGMRFRVLEELDITDPDTGDLLSDAPHEVIKVEVIDVEPRYAIAHTYEAYYVSDLLSNVLARAFNQPLSQWARPVDVRQLRTPDEAMKERGADDGRRFAVADRGYPVEQTAA